MDFLPISQWNREDVTQTKANYWDLYQYKVNGLLICEYNNSLFYYHEPRENKWIEFTPKRGEMNVIESNLSTSDFPQTPTRLPAEQVRQNRQALHPNINAIHQRDGCRMTL